jgi:hypothetical protein
MWIISFEIFGLNIYFLQGGQDEILVKIVETVKNNQDYQG